MVKHYTFDEITIGTKEEFDVEITADNMILFGQMSGDFNPMHVDSDYAIRGGYQDKLVYGMLASSYYSTLVGMYLPGEKCLLNRVDVTYRNPVYIGNRLCVRGEVVDKREGTRRIKIKGEMINQDGIKVNSAEITVGFTNVE